MKFRDNLNMLSEKEAKDRIANAVFTIVLLFLCVALLWTKYVWLLCVEVDGPSMNDTLKTGDLLLADRVGKANRGDVIVFEHDGKMYIKRLIALGGDTIKVKNNRVYLKKNGESEFSLLDEDYAKGLTRWNALEHGAYREEYTVSEGCFFALGDNRGNSHDCRDFGEVSFAFYVGRVPQHIIDIKDSYWNRFFKYL